MAKTVKYSEVLHQWAGIAIVREDGTLKEVSLGVVHTDKKLKETGVKELFTELPKGTIAVEVVKNVDVVTVYEMDVEEFTKIAKVVKVDESAEEAQA